MAFQEVHTTSQERAGVFRKRREQLEEDLKAQYGEKWWENTALYKDLARVIDQSAKLSLYSAADSLITINGKEYAVWEVLDDNKELTKGALKNSTVFKEYVDDIEKMWEGLKDFKDLTFSAEGKELTYAQFFTMPEGSFYTALPAMYIIAYAKGKRDPKIDYPLATLRLILTSFLKSDLTRHERSLVKDILSGKAVPLPYFRARLLRHHPNRRIRGSYEKILKQLSEFIPSDGYSLKVKETGKKELDGAEVPSKEKEGERPRTQIIGVGYYYVDKKEGIVYILFTGENPNNPEEKYGLFIGLDGKGGVHNLKMCIKCSGEELKEFKEMVNGISPTSEFYSPSDSSKLNGMRSILRCMFGEDCGRLREGIGAFLPTQTEGEEGTSSESEGLGVLGEGVEVADHHLSPRAQESLRTVKGWIRSIEQGMALFRTSLEIATTIEELEKRRATLSSEEKHILGLLKKAYNYLKEGKQKEAVEELENIVEVITSSEKSLTNFYDAIEIARTRPFPEPELKEELNELILPEEDTEWNDLPGSEEIKTMWLAAIYLESMLKQTGVSFTNWLKKKLEKGKGEVEIGGKLYLKITPEVLEGLNKGVFSPSIGEDMKELHQLMDEALRESRASNKDPFEVFVGKVAKRYGIAKEEVPSKVAEVSDKWRTLAATYQLLHLPFTTLTPYRLYYLPENIKELKGPDGEPVRVERIEDLAKVLEEHNYHYLKEVISNGYITEKELEMLEKALTSIGFDEKAVGKWVKGIKKKPAPYLRKDQLRVLKGTGNLERLIKEGVVERREISTEKGRVEVYGVKDWERVEKVLKESIPSYLKEQYAVEEIDLRELEKTMETLVIRKPYLYAQYSKIMEGLKESLLLGGPWEYEALAKIGEFVDNMKKVSI